MSQRDIERSTVATDAYTHCPLFFIFSISVSLTICHLSYLTMPVCFWKYHNLDCEQGLNSLRLDNTYLTQANYASFLLRSHLFWNKRVFASINDILLGYRSNSIDNERQLITLREQTDVIQLTAVANRKN